MSHVLSTDFYQLTMMAGYHAAGMMDRATFELYVRALPANRSFLVAAGLEQALDYLETLRFTRDDIDYLRSVPGLERAGAPFFDHYLPSFRFSGDVWAVPEGTPVFPPAPLLRVTAPLPEAQLVETTLLALIGFQTSVASRTARVVEAAAGRSVAEFGSRRAHGPEAGVLAARAAFLGGCEVTSNVEAGRRFGIRVFGTMAHSWVTAFSDEATAFQRYSDVFGNTVILLDTYDVLAAARQVVAMGLTPVAVRLDSGDLIALSRGVRAILDDGGLQATRILVSGDVDEWRVSEIVASGAPIDGFGVGAALSTVSDAPSISAVYKLVEIERGGRRMPVVKRSPGKATLPWRKQVWRTVEGGRAIEDVIDRDDAGHRGRPLLDRVMVDGRRENPSPSLVELRDRSRILIEEIPAAVRRMRDADRYPVRIADSIAGS